MNKLHITIAGAGYVGLSLATLLARRHFVTLVDPLAHKVDMINNRISPIKDECIEEYFKTYHMLDLVATTDKLSAYKNADYVIIATPTNYDEVTQHFDTSSIESVIDDILMYADYFPKAIVIKSTIPIGYTKELREKTSIGNILFSPEFLREGMALEDNLYPSRIVVGVDENDKDHIKEAANDFANMLNLAAIKQCEPHQIVITGLNEAEAIKLFANTYLAMRVSFFNELDSFAIYTNLKSKDIIKGISLDPRIGCGYNNPSFGYGGYCLPKDTKQLLSNYESNLIPQRLMKAVVESNQTRKEVIANDIAEMTMNCGKLFPLIGIYKLAMKSGSDNSRESAVIDILDLLKDYEHFQFVIFDGEDGNLISLQGVRCCNDLEAFLNGCDVIVANRMDEALESVKEKVYTRDVFGNN
jgi:UDPglucose 6-dehydrogenase